MAKLKIIPKSLLEQFDGNLHPASADDCENVVMDLDNLSVDEAISMRDLSTLIPEEVRREMVNKSKQVMALQRDITVMIDQLITIADKESTRKDVLEEAEKPHCEMCGQVVKDQPRTKKRK
jgi:hypothetical protein